MKSKFAVSATDRMDPANASVDGLANRRVPLPLRHACERIADTGSYIDRIARRHTDTSQYAQHGL